MKRLIAFLTCVLGLGMVAPPPASAATFRETAPVRITVEGCSGERVRVSGHLLWIYQYTEDSGGGYHIAGVLVRRQVVGVSASGVTYRVVGGGGRSTAQISGRGGGEVTLTDQFMLVSQGGEDNFLTRFTVHVTANANGETTTEVVRFSAKCVG